MSEMMKARKPIDLVIPVREGKLKRFLRQRWIEAAEVFDEWKMRNMTRKCLCCDWESGRRRKMETYNCLQGNWTVSGIMRSACKQRTQGALLKQHQMTTGRKQEDSEQLEQWNTKWERKCRAVQKQRRSWEGKWRETVQIRDKVTTTNTIIQPEAAKPGRNRKLLKFSAWWKVSVAVWTWVLLCNVVVARGREERKERGKSSSKRGTMVDMVVRMSVVGGERGIEVCGGWNLDFEWLGIVGKLDWSKKKGRVELMGTTILRKCAPNVWREGTKQTGFGWRTEWCWLGDTTLMQNTSTILQTCSLSLVIGSTCTLGSGIWGPSLLGSSLTSLWHTSLMCLPTVARLNFMALQVFFWSYSQPYSLISFEHFPAACLIVASPLTPFELSRTRLLLCFWRYFLSSQNHKHLQTEYEKLT